MIGPGRSKASPSAAGLASTAAGVERTTRAEPAGFPRAERIRRRADFVRIQKNPGARVRSASFLVLLSLREEAESPRLGVVVSKKTGNAVARNRCKRLVREAFRRCKASLPSRVDLICIVHPEMAGKSGVDVAAEFAALVSTIRQRARKLRSETLRA